MQQVNTGVSPQYATVTPASDAHSNGGTVYLTTDYITYRDYYPATSTGATVTTNDQYQTVRQHLSATPTATYTSASDNETTSFLDRYLRQQPTTTNSNGGTSYKTTIHGLTVDLPSPDSGIGEATITPRGENGALPQVSQVSQFICLFFCFYFFIIYTLLLSIHQFVYCSTINIFKFIICEFLLNFFFKFF